MTLILKQFRVFMVEDGGEVVPILLSLHYYGDTSDKT
jgi:hypothetical protein